MAIAYVNGATGSNVNGSPKTSLSAAAFVATAGNTIIVGFRAMSNVTVTDTAGNTYYRVVHNYGATNIGDMSMFYAKNITGHASNVVTASGDSSGYLEICVAQYSGLDKVSPLDVGGSINNSVVSNSVTSPSFTTTQANELIICFATIATLAATFTAGSGYTLRNATAASVFQEKIVSSIQSSVTATITANVSYGFGITVMTLKEEISNQANFLAFF